VQGNDALARHKLGDAYAQGLGIAADHDEAALWYRAAAEEGDRLAAVKLGFLLARHPDAATRQAASGWYRLATAQGGSDLPLPVQLGMASAIALTDDHPDQLKEVRSWLTRAGARSPEAKSWLAACTSAADVRCFRNQQGFGREFTPLAQSLARPAQPRPEGSPVRLAAVRTATLEETVQALETQIEAALALGDTRNAPNAALARMEQAYALAGDADAQVRTRIRRVLLKDALLHDQYGSLNNYFALLSSSCHWGQASRAAYSAGRPEAALFLAKVSVNRLQTARTYLKDLDGDIRECFLQVHQDRYRWLADLFIEQGHFVEAEQVIGMLKDFELANYTDDQVLRGETRTAELAMTAPQQQGLTAINTAGASLAEAIKVLKELKPRRDTLTPQEQARLTGAESLRRSALTTFNAELETLKGLVRDLDATRVERVTEVKSLLNTGVLPDDGTVALHAVVLPDKTVWMLTTNQYQKAVTIELPQRDLNEMVQSLRSAITGRNGQAREIAQALYDLIFKPVDAELKAAGAKHILLSLDGALRYVPFAALHDGRDWLVHRYSMSGFRKKDDVIPRAVPGAGEQWEIAAFGATRAAAGLPELPAVRRELTAIVRNAQQPSGTLEGVSNIDDKFTKDTLADALSRESYHVVHIASHFKLSPAAADQSFLLLGTGDELTLKDIKADGGYRFQRPIQLLTLSACQTALDVRTASGVEVESSLATVALEAGAPAVMASLWSVADASTASLMQNFYAAYAGTGPAIGKAAALQQAQRELLKSEATAHPFYWAPFVLMGNWQ
jgi:CHAT domain-containing protein